MHLPSLNIEKSSIDDNEPSYYCAEVKKVLSMGIPVAIVIKLPHYGMSISTPSYTNILLYFPSLYNVIIYEYTQHEGKVDYKFIGHVGDIDERPETPPMEYLYTLNLTPFIIAKGDMRNKGDTVFHFYIDCAMAGSSVLKVSLIYKDEDRQDEWIELSWYDDSPHRAKSELIARWIQNVHMDKEDSFKSFLIWETDVGEKLQRDVILPHIRGYHEYAEEY